MDSKTMEELGAKIVQVSVSYERKISDGQYGSVGGFFSVTADVALEADPEVALDATFAWVKKAAVRNMKTSFDGIARKDAPAALPRQAPPAAPPAAQPATAPAPAETYEVFAVDTIAIEFAPNGEKRAKAKGGKYVKFGVIVWPEVLALPPLEWVVDDLDAIEYGVPAGVSAKVLLVDGKPKKVVGWA